MNLEKLIIEKHFGTFKTENQEEGRVENKVLMKLQEADYADRILKIFDGEFEDSL